MFTEELCWKQMKACLEVMLLKLSWLSTGEELVFTASRMNILGLDLPPLCTWYVCF